MCDSDDRSKILVVDDTPENIDVLAGILKDNYRVTVARNGTKALELACGDNPPDLILLDVMMPDIDGYEVCRQLQQNQRTQQIPVIFVTARTDVRDETKGLETGAVDYITKPISPAVVLSRIRTHLALRESRKSLEYLSVKLSRYLPPQVYRSIFEGKQDARIGASRKKLTVFLSDIVGFTAQTESMEAEDLTFLLNSYLDCMAGIVSDYGGTLDKYIGDAILVFFGDPDSQGIAEDARACVEMALKMGIAVQELRAEWERTGICHTFEIRMGITTGYCTVGNFGSEERMDYTIIGGQVNLANRLQGAAAPGEILIGPETFALVKDRFNFTEREPILVKGLSEPIQSYRVVGPRSTLKGDGKMEDARDGFSLVLDPAQIDPVEKNAIIEKLRTAISKLL